VDDATDSEGLTERAKRQCVEAAAQIKQAAPAAANEVLGIAEAAWV